MMDFWYSLVGFLFLFSFFTMIILKIAVVRFPKIRLVFLALILLAFVGGVFNIMVTGFNQGKMPVNIKAGGEENETFFEKQVTDSSRHTKLSTNTRLPLLADHVYISFYIPFLGHYLGIASIGDIFYFVGLMAILVITIIMSIVEPRARIKRFY